MQKLNTFFYSFKRSLIDLSYYNEIISTKLSFSLKYYFFLSILISLVYSLTFFIYIPQIKSYIDDNAANIKSMYPETLIITAKNNRISINQPEPYAIPISENIRKDLKEDNQLENFLVFDSKANIRNYSQYKSMIVMSDHTIIYPKDQNLQEQDLSEMLKNSDLEFDRTNFNKMIDSVLPYVRLFINLLIPILFILAFISQYLAITYLLILSILILIIDRIFIHSNIKYLKIFQIGLHLVTIPILVQLAFYILSLGNIKLSVPFYYSIIIIVLSIVILNKVKKGTEIPQIKPLQGQIQ